MSFVKHSLGHTFYISKGNSTIHPPLICLHGGPGGSHLLLKPLLDLSLSKEKRKVFIYDQLGGGKSSKTNREKWNIKTFVQELDSLVKHWNLKEFNLMGTSWGTTLALEYYLRKNGRGVKSLIFQSPMFCSRHWQRDADRLIGNLPLKTKKIIYSCHEIGATDSKVYQNAMLEFYLKHVLRNKAQLIKLFSTPGLLNKEIYEYMWGPSEFRSTGTLRNYNQVLALKKVQVPTLFICGEYDEATPQTVGKYHRLVKHSVFKILKKCSHVINSENSKLLNQTIENFLKLNEL